MLSRIARFSRYGLLLGALLSCLPLIAALVTGSTSLTLRRGEDVSLNVFLVIGSYLSGGVMGGAVVGMLLPLMRWPAGSALLGIVAFVPCATAVGYTLAVGKGEPIDWITVTIISVALGGICGPAYRDMFRDDLQAAGAIPRRRQG